MPGECKPKALSMRPLSPAVARRVQAEGVKHEAANCDRCMLPPRVVGLPVLPGLPDVVGTAGTAAMPTTDQARRTA